MTEADLCAKFASWAREHGWTVYPEVQGVDLVLVRHDAIDEVPRWREAPFLDCAQYRPGEQVAVQAKLVAGIDVLAQAHRSVGPRWRVVLVKRATSEFKYVARQLRVGVVTAESKFPYGSRRWISRWEMMSAGPQSHSRPLALPSIVPNLPAGVPNPRSLTPWREKALRFCVRLRAGERFTRAQVKELAGDPQLWLEKGWICVKGNVPSPLTGRNLLLYGMGTSPLPDTGWEEIRDQLVASR